MSFHLTLATNSASMMRIRKNNPMSRHRSKHHNNKKTKNSCFKSQKEFLTEQSSQLTLRCKYSSSSANVKLWPEPNIEEISTFRRIWICRFRYFHAHVRKYFQAWKRSQKSLSKVPRWNLEKFCWIDNILKRKILIRLPFLPISNAKPMHTENNLFLLA